jgi:hypothetical protein
MQYRLFVSDPCWLPVAPLRDKGGGDEGEDILANNPVDLVELSLTFGITGGPECLKEHLDVGGDSATHFLQNDATANKMRDLRAMHNDLMRVNEESTNQQYQRMADEGTTGECKRHSLYRKTVQQLLVSHSTKKDGYIMMIDQLPGKPKRGKTPTPFVDAPPIETVKPEPFNPQGVIDRMDDVKAAISAKAKVRSIMNTRAHTNTQTCTHKHKH